MDKVLSFHSIVSNAPISGSKRPRYHPSGVDRGRAAQRREVAEHLIRQACGILEELGENDRRVSWLLDDCADLLNKAANRALSAPPTIANE